MIFAADPLISKWPIKDDSAISKTPLSIDNVPVVLTETTLALNPFGMVTAAPLITTECLELGTVFESQFRGSFQKTFLPPPVQVTTVPIAATLKRSPASFLAVRVSARSRMPSAVGNEPGTEATPWSAGFGFRLGSRSGRLPAGKRSAAAAQPPS